MVHYSVNAPEKSHYHQWAYVFGWNRSSWRKPSHGEHANEPGPSQCEDRWWLHQRHQAETLSVCSSLCWSTLSTADEQVLVFLGKTNKCWLEWKSGTTRRFLFRSQMIMQVCFMPHRSPRAAEKHWCLLMNLHPPDWNKDTLVFLSNILFKQISGLLDQNLQKKPCEGSYFCICF